MSPARNVSELGLGLPASLLDPENDLTSGPLSSISERTEQDDTVMAATTSHDLASSTGARLRANASPVLDSNGFDEPNSDECPVDVSRATDSDRGAAKEGRQASVTFKLPARVTRYDRTTGPDIGVELVERTMSGSSAFSQEAQTPKKRARHARWKAAFGRAQQPKKVRFGTVVVISIIALGLALMLISVTADLISHPDKAARSANAHNAWKRSLRRRAHRSSFHTQFSDRIATSASRLKRRDVHDEQVPPDALDDGSRDGAIEAAAQSKAVLEDSPHDRGKSLHHHKHHHKHHVHASHHTHKSNADAIDESDDPTSEQINGESLIDPYDRRALQEQILATASNASFPEDIATTSPWTMTDSSYAEEGDEPTNFTTEAFNVSLSGDGRVRAANSNITEHTISETKNSTSIQRTVTDRTTLNDHSKKGDGKSKGKPMKPAAAAFSALVVFGASYCDNGHPRPDVYKFTLSGPPYVGGRRSNGPVFDEYLARKLNVPMTNYAYIGAHINNDATGYNGSPPDSKSQIASYLSDVRSGAFKPGRGRVLHVIWNGINPILYSIWSDWQKGSSTLATAELRVSQAVADLGVQIVALQAGQADKSKADFVILPLPPLGSVPASRYLAKPIGDATQLAVLAALTRQFNIALDKLIEDVKAAGMAIGQSIYTFDAEAYFSEGMSSPDKLGLTDGNDACWNSTTGGICKTP
ncbi:uncharacterized protein L969DRAFT_92460 [Mixia osmundae IAM 14324]|uniref:Uncharacterized protein n=1 Tax=Mixia osmundae (strain CBS 9802 / IAM 14324 / JCM 22182 / KY 12970) TaxID=764103 RepID=G7DXH1_MIXOS|nr:uncharacterized protein L969DRAFT_92460 [Mixia osmundae IAM 14324]KEI41225.1 hypothetical protein L969DRAFT_92460 [Mixia osmundae IAM 14324]GAA95281.1 hypothetical protein E5Q_01937 [Mixia osmundae IAM 14324]